jgi:hypothetical protein
MKKFAVLAVSLLSIGCPASEDIYQVEDVGLRRQDILLPGGDVQGFDIPNVQNDSGPITTDDTNRECETPADCQGLEPGECELVRCTTEGQCVLENKPTGNPCSDDDECTNTQCDGGVCTVTTQVECPDEDQNECTIESCRPDQGCTVTNKLGTPCDDGDPCTVDDKCNEGVCIAGTLSCALGTQENPAANCKALLTAAPATPSGLYWITTTAGPTEVWCDMTTAGGGWIRIGVLNGQLPVCSLVAGLGDAAAVKTGTGNAFLSATTVNSFNLATDDVLVNLTAGPTIFTSSSVDWRWQAIADGTINANNVVTYGVQAAVAGGAFVTLKNNGLAAGKKGPSLLGGMTPDNKYTLVLGTGAQGFGAFVQDSSCTAQAGVGGAWGGTALPSVASWGKPASVFVR